MPQFGPVCTWSSQHVSRWISGLHPLARQHAPSLLHHNVTGEILLQLTWASLDTLKINGMYDQEALLTAISILRDVDSTNKNYLLYPLADKALQSAIEAIDHLSYLKMNKRDLHRKQKLYMSCIKCGNLTRSILLHMDKYHIGYNGRSKLAHDLLCCLYSISHAAQQLKYGLRNLGIHMPELPQELPHNSRSNSYSNCLQVSLSSIVENTRFIKERSDVVSRGCPTFERITLQPDGDTGWGFSFRETSSGIYIIKRILPMTPADKSGRIKSGDEVIEVNDQNIVGWKIKNVVELIRTHPAGLVMVVRHYPESTQHHDDVTPLERPIPRATPHLRTTPPHTPILQVPLTPGETSPRTKHISGTFSEPAVDTPKKPPRPLDSVLRERCKSNNELDQHFKTVLNPKRLSQIYGDKKLFMSYEDMITNEGLREVREVKRPSKRTNPKGPVHVKRNNSNPLDKYNTVSNRDWMENLAARNERARIMNKYKYGTGPRVKTTNFIDFLNASMPDIAISTDNIQMEDKSTGCDMDITPPYHYHTLPRDYHVNSNGNHGNGIMLMMTSPSRDHNHVTADKVDLVPKNLALFCDKLSDDDNNRSEDNESTATTPSTISNCTSIMTSSSMTSARSKTLPRRPRNKEENVGEFKNYPVTKESNYTTVVIGGVVHKIPVPSSTVNSSEEESHTEKNSTLKNRKRQNKRSSWSISSDKAATLPKNIRFSLADLDENGTLKKKKNKKPSRSTSAILGDTNVSCRSLYPNACEGWLSKLGGSGLTPRNWRRRWFVLKGFCLYYFKTPQDNTALGVITLPSFNIATAPEMKKKNAFKASHKNTRTFYFVAEGEQEKQRWMDKMLLASILYDESDRESGYGTGASPVAAELCSMTIEKSIISPCPSLHSIGSTTVV